VVAGGHGGVVGAGGHGGVVGAGGHGGPMGGFRAWQRAGLPVVPGVAAGSPAG
jgi:hypothetical protein